MSMTRSIALRAIRPLIGLIRSVEVTLDRSELHVTARMDGREIKLVALCDERKTGFYSVKKFSATIVAHTEEELFSWNTEPP